MTVDDQAVLPDSFAHDTWGEVRMPSCRDLSELESPGPKASGISCNTVRACDRNGCCASVAGVVRRRRSYGRSSSRCGVGDSADSPEAPLPNSKLAEVASASGLAALQSVRSHCLPAKLATSRLTCEDAKLRGMVFLIDTSVVMAVIQVISCDHTLLGIFSWTVLMCHRLQDRDHSSWLKVLAECILSLQSWSCYQQNR